MYLQSDLVAMSAHDLQELLFALRQLLANSSRYHTPPANDDTTSTPTTPATLLHQCAQSPDVQWRTPVQRATRLAVPLVAQYGTMRDKFGWEDY